MPSKLQLLPDDIEERLAALPRKLEGFEGLDAMWLFGSFARGEATPVSDVDLAYLPASSLEGEVLERWKTDLYVTVSGALHTDEFTFADIRRAPAPVAWRVLDEGRLLVCANEEAVCELKEAILARFADPEPYAKERRRAVKDWLEDSEMEVDGGRLYELLENIREELQFLREAEEMASPDYRADERTQRVTERALQRAAEAGIAVGNHIISRLGLRAPQDYADVFQVLGRSDILARELADRMADMARLRNLLVHVYWEIDQERLHASLLGRIETLEEFSRSIGRWLRDRDTSPE